MISAALLLLLSNSLFFSLRLSGNPGSFPKPLSAEEEQECLERWAHGDLEARNRLVEHNLRLVAPRRLLEAQLFNQQYQNYEDIPNVQDRLRWCRHHMGLMQKEVADLIGITRGHYIDFEVGYVDHYPKEIVDKLAALYQVPVDDLLDDYNRFLYKGQTDCKLSLSYR